MSDSLSFKYTMTEDDVVRASLAQVKLGKRKWLLLAMVPAVLLLAIFAFQGNWRGILELLASVALIGITILLLTRFVRWTARKSPHIGVEYETTASQDGMTWNSPFASTQSKWTAYTSVRETAEYFMFYCGLAMCAAIPKRSFADSNDMDRFRDLIRAHVPKFNAL